MLERIERIVRDAGKIVLSAHTLSVTEKEGHANFVTDMDVRVQQYLMDTLKGLVPDARFISEEKENQPLTDGWTWIVDPIDGTTNLIHDFRLSAISVALFAGKAPLYACVYNPFTDEMFRAERGRGAFLNGRGIHVSGRKMEKALVCVGTSPYNPELREKSMAIASEFLRRAADIRRTGAAALDLCYVACGRADIFYELLLKPWDFAAGALVLQEAGGILDMPALRQVDYGRVTAILAANRECFDAAKAVVAAGIGPGGLPD